MGQAKRNGTFEQRKALAQARNQALLANIQGTPNHPLQPVVRTLGIQRVATRLTAVGLLKVQADLSTANAEVSHHAGNGHEKQ